MTSSPRKCSGSQFCSSRKENLIICIRWLPGHEVAFHFIKELPRIIHFDRIMGQLSERGRQRRPSSVYLQQHILHGIDHMKHLEYKLCPKSENIYKRSELSNLRLKRKKQEKTPILPHYLAEILWSISLLQKHLLPMPMSTLDSIITVISMCAENTASL